MRRNVIVSRRMAEVWFDNDFRPGFVPDRAAEAFEKAMRDAILRDRWLSLRGQRQDGALALLARLSRVTDTGWPTRAGNERWLAYGRAAREIRDRRLP